MIGLGTLYNALGVVFGGLLGLLIGQRAWKSCEKSRKYDVDSESSDRDRYRGTLED